MLVNIFFVILAILGLSFLIFIHELGHYWMARRVGMRVETFSIGLGRPIFQWVRDGVRWQIGWLLFGGYVKIAGHEPEKGLDPYTIPDGFFGKSPWDRIKVAAMGPIVNLIFALLVFAVLWGIGGRTKNFSEFTHKIGWVDPRSELYAQGVRPGDEILSYNDAGFQGAKDHIYSPLVAGDEVTVQGLKVNYATGEKTPFEYTVKTYPHPSSVDKGIKTAGILSSANYFVYTKLPGGAENPLPEGSPLQNSGIQYGDRVVWADGEEIFSEAQMNDILNDKRALLTVERDGKTMLRRVPRIMVQELKLDPSFKEELVDWQFAARLNATKLPKLYMIPYNLTNEAVVENDVKFIDKENQQEAFPTHPFSLIEEALQPGDKIIAVDGVPIQHSYELLSRLQHHQVHLIVERNPTAIVPILWREADGDFDRHVEAKSIKKIADSIGTGVIVKSSGDLYLLKPVQPKMRAEFFLSPEKQAWEAAEQLELKKKIEGIEDPEKRAQALEQVEKQEKRLLLGLPMVQDRKVNYNPGPLEIFNSVFQEIWRTLVALVSGAMNPKWLSGPVGIVQVVHDYSMISLKEALFWLGAISLNLGVLNLLPIPVLDGGTILMTLFEWVTGRRLHPKTLEKIIIPFAVLLIIFFIFITYHDITRIFGGLWS